MNDVFLINENLIVDGPFRDFLLATAHCRVTQVIMGFKSLSDINYISPADKGDSVSFLPSSKIKFIELINANPFDDGIGRGIMKIGKLVSKIVPQTIINQYISPAHIEEFVNLYKSFFDDNGRQLIVVNGKDIKKYYLDKNYCNYNRGTLWKSCMRYSDRQDFLELYAVNPDKIKMLVLLENDRGVNKVKARALLWEDVDDQNGNKLKVMDRIYTIFDSDVYIFKRWARENGYITKYKQNAKSQNRFDLNGEDTYINLSVQLTTHKLEYYPYLDSFQFYDPRSGKFYNYNSGNHLYTLIQANGGLEPGNGEDDGDDDLSEPWDLEPEEGW